MKIAKTSWHYQLNRNSNEHFEYWFDKGRYTTCSYVRRTLVSMLALMFKSIMCLAGLATIVFVVGSMLVVPVMLYMGHKPHDIPGIMCLIGWIFAIMFSLFVILSKVKEILERPSRKPFKARKKKEHGVFVQAIIDKHNKFCTLVTAE